MERIKGKLRDASHSVENTGYLGRDDGNVVMYRDSRTTRQLVGLAQRSVAWIADSTDPTDVILITIYCRDGNEFVEVGLKLHQNDG